MPIVKNKKIVPLAYLLPQMKFVFPFPDENLDNNLRRIGVLPAIKTKGYREYIVVDS